jgi:hypothetical protein
VSHPPPEHPPTGDQPPYPYGQQPPYAYGQPPQPYPYYYAPQQWRPPPPIDPKQLKPSRLWYWLSPIPALIGVAISVLFVIQVVDRFDTDLDHFRTPDTVVQTLQAGDERAIYVQTVGATGARPLAASELSCSVRDAASERSVPLDSTSGFTLTIGSDEYVERFQFTAPHTGRYAVTCTEPRGLPLAVGQNLSLKSFVLPIVAAIVAFLLGLALTAAIAITTGVKRSNHKQQLQREAVAAGVTP